MTVDQDSFNAPGIPGTQTGWFVPSGSSTPAGITELAAGPKTPPAHPSPGHVNAGSLRLTTDDATQQTVVTNTTDFSGVLLKDITAAKYSTYVDEDSEAGPVEVSLKLNIPGHTLVFEPYLAPEYASATAAAAHGNWHTWNAGSASRGWWATPNGSVPACTMNTSCSFAQLKHEVDFNGTVKVNNAQLAVGTSNPKFDGNVDLLEVKVGGQTTRYNFESNQANSDIVTRVDEANGAGWTFEGGVGTGSNGAFDVHYTAGPNLPGGLSGHGSVSLNHRGPGTAMEQGSYSAIVQDYFEGNGDLTQAYLGSIDNIEAKTYRLSTSTKGDYPSVRFEVRLPDPETQFAFASIVNTPSPATTGNIDNVSAVHPVSPTVNTKDTATWYLTRDIAGLTKETSYTWAQLMRTDLRDAVILKALVMAGSSTGDGEFNGGVDLLRFSYRDGSSQTWDFEKAPAAPPAAPTALTATAAPSGASEIALSWTDNSNDFNSEDGFAIERSTSATFLPASEVTVSTVGPNVTSYTDTGLLPNKQYFYRVRAGNRVGASGYSNVANATTGTPPPPPASDTFAPTATITTEDNSFFPPDGPVHIEGTAADLADDVPAGVTRVGLEVRDQFGRFVQWQWVCGEPNYSPACPANVAPAVMSWSVDIQLPVASAFTGQYLPGIYTLTAYAYDAAGNYSASDPIRVGALN